MFVILSKLVLRSVSLSAPFCHPSAGAGAAHALALPNAAAAALGEVAGAVGPLAAGLHQNPHGSLCRDPSLHRGHAAAVDQRSVGDLHAVAIAAVASPAIGDDENAPIAIVYGSGKSHVGDAAAE